MALSPKIVALSTLALATPYLTLRLAPSHDVESTVHNLALLKTLPVLALAAVAAASPRGAADHRQHVAAGLASSAVGDALLEFDSPNSAPGFFLGGLLAFLTAHLFYSVGFYKDFSGLRTSWWAAYAAYATAMLLVLYPSLPRPLVLPVLVYAAALAAMGSLSLSRADAFAPWLWGTLGSLSFIVSDSVLALNRFAPALVAPLARLFDPIDGPKLVIMLTYYAAQLGVCLSVVSSCPGEASRAAHRSRKAE